jgi:hypothetical protein
MQLLRRQQAISFKPLPPWYSILHSSLYLVLHLTLASFFTLSGCTTADREAEVHPVPTSPLLSFDPSNLPKPIQTVIKDS